MAPREAPHGDGRLVVRRKFTLDGKVYLSGQDAPTDTDTDERKLQQLQRIGYLGYAPAIKPARSKGKK